MFAPSQALPTPRGPVRRVPLEPAPRQPLTALHRQAYGPALNGPGAPVLMILLGETPSPACATGRAVAMGTKRTIAARWDYLTDESAFTSSPRCWSAQPRDHRRPRTLGAPLDLRRRHRAKAIDIPAGGAAATLVLIKPDNYRFDGAPGSIIGVLRAPACGSSPRRCTR
jgi:hypothetical protein